MEALIKRVNDIIEICWGSFSAKIGCGLIEINKEASMQLNFAYLLKNTIDLAIHHEDEKIIIELETTIPINGKTKECDIVIKIEKADNIFYLPIEMKCYKEFASSGGKRGALDIFFKDVHADIELLESYSKKENFLKGIMLVMTDFKNAVFPVKKNGKYWDYDISHGSEISGSVIKNTAIGGFEVSIQIDGNYSFNWKEFTGFYFLKLETDSKLTDTIHLI
ncbi:hypothetical protein [Flavobacterium sp. FlaQc-28]|uniref:hypothetical protein n=1 Tax=Flavobacterium sp. FlaQc-28 TaxID=3374178 RepID=UPI00375713A5